MPAKKQPTVTIKDTKSKIMEAYKNALATISELESQKFDPIELKAKEDDRKAVEFAEDKQWDLAAVFAKMRNSIDDNLRDVQSQLEREKRDLDTVARAKQAVAAELKELYGISKEAQTFAALVEAQKKEEEDFKLEMEQRKAEVDDYVADRRSGIEAEQDLWEEDRKRKEQEWEYEFKRRCKQQEDELADALEASKKKWLAEVEAKEKDMAERMDELVKREDEVAELKKKVETFPQQLEAAKDEARKKAGQSHGIEINAIKRSHEADTRVLTHDVESLKAVKIALEAKIVDLESKLEAAYERIQGVASKALEAQGSAAMTAEVQKAVAAATTGKGR